MKVSRIIQTKQILQEIYNFLFTKSNIQVTTIYTENNYTTCFKGKWLQIIKNIKCIFM